jgi:hypothetical protein
MSLARGLERGLAVGLARGLVSGSVLCGTFLAAGIGGKVYQKGKEG